MGGGDTEPPPPNKKKKRGKERETERENVEEEECMIFATAIYRGTLFNCEYLLIVNCELYLCS